MSAPMSDWLRVFDYLREKKIDKGVITAEDYLTAREELSVSVFALNKARWLIETMDEIDNTRDIIGVKRILFKMAKEVAKKI